MTRVRHPSTPVALLSFSLSLALAAMACDAVLQTGAPDPDGVLDSQPSLPQEPEDDEGSPPVSQEPSGDQAEYSGEFLEADCACAGYEPSRVFPWGNASLDCRYDWSGPNIDQNALGFSVAHFYHTENLAPGFQERVEGLTASLPPQAQGITRDRSCATMARDTRSSSTAPEEAASRGTSRCAGTAGGSTGSPVSS